MQCGWQLQRALTSPVDRFWLLIALNKAWRLYSFRHNHTTDSPNCSMCASAKRFRSSELLPDCTVKQIVQYMPHNTYLYLHRADREPVCCQQALYSACKQCDAVRRHAAMLWPCLRAIRSPAYASDEAGRSSFALMVDGILELHLHMQQDDDYEPVYSGQSIARAQKARAAWNQQNSM